MPNFNEPNRANEFQPVFKETRQPSVQAHTLVVAQQVRNAADKINRITQILAQSKHLLANENLSLERRQNLEDAVKVSTAELAQLEKKLEQMANRQSNRNHLPDRR